MVETGSGERAGRTHLEKVESSSALEALNLNWWLSVPLELSSYKRERAEPAVITQGHFPWGEGSEREVG